MEKASSRINNKKLSIKVNSKKESIKIKLDTFKVTTMTILVVLKKEEKKG